jgi:prepilin-type N-terminal cleavage/methylation domain-containing protein
MNRSGFGFTLVELLTVIAIIAVLSAVLFPVLASAKRSAQNSVALDELMQIGHATQIYSGDFDDHLPHALGNNCFHLLTDAGAGCDIFGPAELTNIPPINAILQRYGATWNVYRSPVDKMSSALLQEPGHQPTWFEETKTSAYPGSSYEYLTALGVKSRSYSSLSLPSSAVLLYSMYFVGEGQPDSRNHVLFSDGHSKLILHTELGSDLETTKS